MAATEIDSQTRGEEALEQRDDWHLTEILDYRQGRGDPFAAAVRATRMPMVITDPSRDDNPIVFVNEAFQLLTGYDREEILGRNCRFLQGELTDKSEVARIRYAVGAGRDVAAELLNYRKDGSTFWNALYLSPVRDDGGRIRFYFASQLDVTDRVQAQATLAEQKAAVEREVEARTADLEAALAQKTVLLHEVDHRVKNNLTMIGSLLRLQARDIDDPAISAKLESMLERVDALSTVHRRLYQSDDVTRFDVGAFARNLIDDVLGAAGRTDISLVARIERIDVASSRAAALGLVLNEVATNAVKHAYANGRPGKLRLEAYAADGLATIIVADDGPGMPQAPRRGLGSTLVARLGRQVGATPTWASEGQGTTFTLSFPLDAA